MESRAVPLYPKIESYISGLIDELDRIPPERREALDRLAGFVARRAAAGQPAELIFICTHNSRRSQLAQVWAKTVAAHLGVPGVEAFSGGIEATAFNPRAVAALVRAGFRVEVQRAGENPVLAVRCADQAPPLECFSKVYDRPPNPVRGFCAVMTCSSADEACPIVAGAAARISLPYDDPKDFDETYQEEAAYDDRCRQIAREMLAVFSGVHV